MQKQPELLNRELTAATRRAEMFLRRSIITQTLRGLFVAEPADCSCQGVLIKLPRGHVQSVKSVTRSDGTVIDEGGYTVYWDAIKLLAPETDPVTVQWVSGYGDSGADVPDSVREGILGYALMLYEDRTGERPATGQQTVGKGIPPGVRDIWRSEQIEVG